MSNTPETQEAVERWQQGKINIFDEMARLETERDRYKSDVELITKERDEARKQLRVAVGLLSTTPQFQDQHPEEVFTFVEEAAQ